MRLPPEMIRASVQDVGDFQKGDRVVIVGGSLFPRPCKFGTVLSVSHEHGIVQLLERDGECWPMSLVRHAVPPRMRSPRTNG